MKKMEFEGIDFEAIDSQQECPICHQVMNKQYTKRGTPYFACKDCKLSCKPKKG